MYDIEAENRRRDALSIREAAARLGVSQALLWKLIRKGDIAVVRLGGRTLVADHELRRLLRADV